jgi:hypothetical protein
MKQCCVPTFRRDYLPPASWYLPQKIIRAHLVILQQILPEYTKQEAPIIKGSLLDLSPLLPNANHRHVAVPNPFLRHRYFGPYYLMYCAQITVTVLYFMVIKHTYPAVRHI